MVSVGDTTTGAMPGRNVSKTRFHVNKTTFVYHYINCNQSLPSYLKYAEAAHFIQPV